MGANDGLVVRIRPRLARLTREQVLGLCELATRYGSGSVELTSRANLQLRGVAEASHAPLLQALGQLRLLDPDAGTETRRNVIVAPLWQADDVTFRLATELVRRLEELPTLSPKFGFAVDAGRERVLADVSADVRLERDADGGLIVRADGVARGRRTSVDEGVDAALSLARWFADSGGAEAGRMARHVAHSAPPDAGRCEPAPLAEPLRPGTTALGRVFGAAFGSVAADDLAHAVRRSGARAVRVTPWRMIVLEGGARSAPAGAPAGLITDATDPLLRVDACIGAPDCASATVETRTLARALTSRGLDALIGAAPARLHVSGCEKGCARPRAVAITLVGRDGRFDLVRDAPPWAEPVTTGLSPEAVHDRLAGAMS